MRNAAASSPFCRAHELVARDAARPRGTFVETAGEILQDVIAGRGINREKVAKAVHESIWEMGGGYAQYMPDLENVDFGRVFGQAQQAAQQARERFRQPPVDPQVEEQRRAVAQARQELGFGPADAITADQLRARHRELAKKHHPDRGGSVERMQRINAAVDLVASTIAA